MTFSLPLVAFLLVAGHALADFGVQGEYMANAKNRNTALGKDIWPMVLGAHAMIHGVLVGLITGSVVLALLETAAHATIDFRKCEGKLTYHQDQVLHIVCKALWFTIYLVFMR
jgi:hypothetical protein